MWAYNEKIYALTIRDFPTGLYNRRYLEEALRRELQRAARNAGAVGVAVLSFVAASPGAVLLIGHDALAESARRLRAATRFECVARSADFEIVLFQANAGAEDMRRDG